ncbi:hypothetical protein GDO78_019466 [Eleutherodactylus coqui]|uniref:Uncharacterized protein n=1 Tax=Eleutherodactylus coqui TaxID=57060 RepID=A0A8J6B0F1_ELECQ|nr:hypothetical protein GDO78_019466 [Eleutherodactylus coqui]
MHYVRVSATSNHSIRPGPPSPVLPPHMCKYYYHVPLLCCWNQKDWACSVGTSHILVQVTVSWVSEWLQTYLCPLIMAVPGL